MEPRKKNYNPPKPPMRFFSVVSSNHQSNDKLGTHILMRIRLQCIWDLKTKESLNYQAYFSLLPILTCPQAPWPNITSPLSNHSCRNSVPFSQEGTNAVSVKKKIRLHSRPKWIRVETKSQKATKQFPFQVSVFWVKRRLTERGAGRRLGTCSQP